MRSLLGQLEHRRRCDMKFFGKNLRRLRQNRNLSVEDVREYLDLASVQAIYKYETGRNYPQADILLALMELYQADYMDLICEKVDCCSGLRKGDWLFFIAPESQQELVTEIVIVS